MGHPHPRGHSHHNYEHSHGGGSQNRRGLSIALAITATYTLAEVIGGLITGSLALLADAGHMLSDNFSLGLALFAFWLSAKPPTPEPSTPTSPTSGTYARRRLSFGS
jgi:cobalt-zinc-cadmium efflux system protein